MEWGLLANQSQKRKLSKALMQEGQRHRSRAASEGDKEDVAS